jgi:hypothetical protein
MFFASHEEITCPLPPPPPVPPTCVDPLVVYRRQKGKNMGSYIPNPRHVSPLAISMFEFVGKLMGLSLRYKQSLPFTLYVGRSRALVSLRWLYTSMCWVSRVVGVVIVVHRRPPIWLAPHSFTLTRVHVCTHMVLSAHRSW